MDLATSTQCLNPSAAPARAAAATAEPAARFAASGAPVAPGSADPRLAALDRARALLRHLEAERDALNRRLEEARRLDPMRQVVGRTSLDQAVEETRRLVEELDGLLGSPSTGARTAAHTHPKDSR